MDPCTAAEGEAWRRCPEGINKGRDWRSRARSLCTREPLAEHATNREVIQHVEAHHLHRMAKQHYALRRQVASDTRRLSLQHCGQLPSQGRQHSSRDGMTHHANGEGVL